MLLSAFPPFKLCTLTLMPPLVQYVLLPIPLIIQAPCRVDPKGDVWNRVRASVGQPNFE